MSKTVPLHSSFRLDLKLAQFQETGESTERSSVKNKGLKLVLSFQETGESFDLVSHSLVIFLFLLSFPLDHSF